MAGNMIKITDYDKVIPTKDDVLLINQNGSNRKTTVNDLVGDISTLGGKKLIEKVNENTTSLNANTQKISALETYTEGTFVPAIEGSVTSGVDAYSKQVGTYKINNKILYFECEIELTGISPNTVGYIVLKGLPYACNHLINLSLLRLTDTSITKQLTPQILNNKIWFYKVVNTNEISGALETTDISNTTTLKLSGSYFI